MKSFDHQRAKEIFNDALELPYDRRSDFVSSQCGADAALRAEVESLLASHDEDFLEESVRLKIMELICGGLLPGDVISARYKIVEMIGSGGMGDVYLAEDTTMKRNVAVKVLAEKFSQDKKQVKSFENEARTVSQLNHQNILTVHDFVYGDHTNFIISEFIEGETLRKKLKAGPLGLSKALKITRQIASALEAAHAKGIVHRDVKPENVIVKENGHVKVLDFGIAQLAERRTTDDELKPTWSMQEEAAAGFGTANYMSWEQVRGQEVDARTDIWSLGVCLYEMLTGTPPFKGEKAIDTFASILKDDPAPLGQRVPESVNAIIKKALKKNRDKRYQTMREFAHDLETSPETATKAVEPFKEWRKTSGAKIWAILLCGSVFSCVLAAVLALTIYYFQPLNVGIAARSAQAVGSAFHLIMIFIAFWYFRKNPGPQGFRPLKYDKAEGRLKSHITYSTGYEKISDWRRAREIAKESLKHYRDAFVWLLFAWLFLYSVVLVSLVEKSSIVASVLTLANNLNTLAIGLCFAILNEPITTEDKTQDKKAITVAEGRRWPASLIPAVIVMIFLFILELWLSSKVDVHYIFKIVSGLGGGVAMALFVGRFQSKFLQSPPWLVSILFLYTVIQALYLFYGGEMRKDLAGAAVVINAALVLKCLLILYMFWLFQSGRLLFYLVRVRRATTQVDSEWQNFREVLQQES
ncbi:MAG TPA: serine/threonine-protein kinase [Pyrinomonadaceae bacterium]|nr:serine/threonine-protein kinase [Pyrinomonadaceae bacterium]